MPVGPVSTFHGLPLSRFFRESSHEPGKLGRTPRRRLCRWPEKNPWSPANAELHGPGLGPYRFVGAQGCVETVVETTEERFVPSNASTPTVWVVPHPRLPIFAVELTELTDFRSVPSR